MNNNYEEMLRKGMSIDEILNTIRSQLTETQTKINSELKERRAKSFVDISNRALENNLTANDVAYIFKLYAMQKYPNHQEIFNETITPEMIDEVISMTTSLLSDSSILRDFLKNL